MYTSTLPRPADVVEHPRPTPHVEPVRRGLLATAVATAQGAEQATLRLLRRFAAPALRIALGVVYLWFGALKIIGESPIADLVASMVPFLPADAVVVSLGVVEVIFGALLLIGRLVPWVCAAIVGHLLTTFLVAVVFPAVVFVDGNPLLVTMEGEFIAKNLVLIGAAMAVAAFSRSSRRSTR
ncbi:DoxX family membrane protein [Herbiconiux sp. L3-i23]|uniref:DoxX family membrane protein n=1 Tax=Herbiconiux sp. L3-i23 TaxID=2905871 RepID=UPI00205E7CCD|nr:DoxX family membrane protein [Herbiconiux sp. L3-i23]BDI22787.1 hypothetical protein L3i23_15630 [Herbiconiux sp. L3-i23]